MWVTFRGIAFLYCYHYWNGYVKHNVYHLSPTLRQSRFALEACFGLPLACYNNLPSSCFPRQTYFSNILRHALPRHSSSTYRHLLRSQQAAGRALVRTAATGEASRLPSFHTTRTASSRSQTALTLTNRTCVSLQIYDGSDFCSIVKYR